MKHLRVGDRVRHVDVAMPSWSESGPAMPRTPRRRLYGRVVSVLPYPGQKELGLARRVRVKRDGVKTIDTWAELAWERARRGGGSESSEVGPARAEPQSRTEIRVNSIGGDAPK
jgi:hypothetical protein